MSARFDTKEFEFSHGKLPRGYGSWVFVFDKPSFRWDCSDAVFAPTSTYSEAHGRAGRAVVNSEQAAALAAELDRRHPMKTWKIRLYRDNRWDIYPQQETIHEVIVTCRRREMLGEAVYEQCPGWRCSFIFASVEEVSP